MEFDFSGEGLLCPKGSSQMSTRFVPPFGDFFCDMQWNLLLVSKSRRVLSSSLECKSFEVCDL